MTDFKNREKCQNPEIMKFKKNQNYLDNEKFNSKIELPGISKIAKRYTIKIVPNISQIF